MWGEEFILLLELRQKSNTFSYFMDAVVLLFDSSNHFLYTRYEIIESMKDIESLN